MEKQFSAARQFISTLLAIADMPKAALPTLEANFAAALLDFGSETEDNLACVDRIGIREIPHRYRGHTFELSLKSSGTRISEILNFAEGSELPKEVRERFPDLEQNDWDAALRIATLVFSALSSKR